MSCGTPHDGCAKVIEAVYLYLDGEMDDADCAEVRSHLEDCVPCLREYGLEEDFKRLVARKCGCDPAPEELRSRVLTRLREVRVELATVEFRTD
ncbi:MAG TPA: mycothiol system anti-sigma-R factor [Mycobacteriales bacterium]|nr:mycothiol system anti-sigma-R factor [Mycobacteriales bacterium]